MVIFKKTHFLLAFLFISSFSFASGPAQIQPTPMGTIEIIEDFGPWAKNSILSYLTKIDSDLDYWKKEVINLKKSWITLNKDQKIKEAQTHIDALQQEFDIQISLLGSLHSNIGKERDVIFQAMVDKSFGSMKRSIKIHARPSWFSRNQKSIGATALATLVALILIKKYSSQLTDTSTKAVEILKHCLNQYIKKPITEIKKIITGQQDNLVMSNDAYTNVKTEVERGLKKWLKKIKPNATPQEQLTIINNIIDNHDTQLLDYHLHDQLSHWAKNGLKSILYNSKDFTIGEVFSLELLIHKLHAHKLAMHSTQAVQLLLPIAALVPTSLGLFGLYGIGKKIAATLYNTMVNQKILDLPLKNMLLNLERFINLHNNGTQITDHDWGMLLYQTHDIRAKSKSTKKINHELLEQDIAELESVDFSLNQKLATLARMFRTHAALA